MPNWAFALLACFGLMVLDWIFGSLAAWRLHTFTWSAWPKQLYSMVLPYLTPLIAVGLGQVELSFQSNGFVAGPLAAGVAAAIYAFCSALAIRLLADIKDKAATLVSNAPKGSVATSSSGSKALALAR
jgi:hypothetical protein